MHMQLSWIQPNGSDKTGFLGVFVKSVWAQLAFGYLEVLRCQANDTEATLSMICN